MSSFNAATIITSAAALSAVGLGVYVLTKRATAKKPVEPWDNAHVQKEFEAAFPALSEEFLAHTMQVHGMPDKAIARLRRMLTYTCVGGKCNRGVSVVTTTRDICASKLIEFDEAKQKEAIVLGWCIEILQACFLVADDIMDSSVTRRGQPCWYRLPEIQLDAVNDSLILESFIYYLLKRYFGGKSCYVALMELYHEVSYQTQLGQMMDLYSNPQGQKSLELLNNFNLDLYKKIVRYKTAYYTFYLPFASALIICGVTSPKILKMVEEISVELGEKFQIQDDWLDCYGDPTMIGKIGTDIQDHKCSWLVVQALLKAKEDQKAILREHYGCSDPQSVSKVKNLYNELKLTNIYLAQEEDSYNRICKLIEGARTILPTQIFEVALKKIHKRQK